MQYNLIKSNKGFQIVRSLRTPTGFNQALQRSEWSLHRLFTTNVN